MEVGRVERCIGCMLEDQPDKRIHCAEDNYRLAEAIPEHQSLENRQEIGRRKAKIHSYFKRVENNSPVSRRIRQNKFN